MGDVDDVIKRLERQAASNAARDARDQAKLEALIVEARAEGYSLRDIAPAARLSHEKVRQIIDAATAN